MDFFIVHPGQRMIKMKQHNFRIDVNPDYLLGYNGDAEERARNSIYIHSRDFLIMPIHNSPMYVFLTSARNTWVPRYVDSLAVITNLTIIIHAYTTNPGLNYYTLHKERIDSAKELWDENLTVLDNKYKNEQLPDIYRRFANEEINEKQALQEFLIVMENATFERIRISERCLAMIFGLPCLETPKEVVNINNYAKEQRAKFPEILCHYFETKQQVLNQRMKLATPEDEEFVSTQYFDIEDMKTRFERAEAEEIFKGYIDRMTAWEYFVYLDIQEILKRGKN